MSKRGKEGYMYVGKTFGISRFLYTEEIVEKKQHEKVYSMMITLKWVSMHG